MRKITGTVTSDKGDKTIVVTITTRKTHPVYGKSYIVSKKIAAHDPKNEAKIGDKVIIAESKPISKTKSFILDKILERGHETVEIAKTVVEQEIEDKLAEKAAKAEEKKLSETESSEIPHHLSQKVVTGTKSAAKKEAETVIASDEAAQGPAPVSQKPVLRKQSSKTIIAKGDKKFKLTPSNLELKTKKSTKETSS